MNLYELLMTDHEEEILSHLTQLDYDNAAIAKAYQFLPINQAVHKLDEENIETPVYVPAMFADVLIAMSTETTADSSLAQLKARQHKRAITTAGDHGIMYHNHNKNIPCGL